MERIVSGKGLFNVYEFYKEEYPEEINEVYDEKINAAFEAGAVIASLAYDYSLCAKAMDFVFDVYGTEAGSVALKYLPYGGLYIAGSLAPRNIERLKAPDSPFLRAALDKGRVSPALESVSRWKAGSSYAAHCVESGKIDSGQTVNFFLSSSCIDFCRRSPLTS